MKKFTISTLVLIAVICLGFFVIISKQEVVREQEIKAEETTFNEEQKAAIPEKMDDITIEHAKGVRKDSEKKATEILNDLDEDKKELVVEYGDTVYIDYVGISDGKEFEGGTSEDFRLEIGSNSFITGYEYQLETHKIGDVVDVKVTFPEEYSSPELAGKNALFIVTIKDIEKA